MPKLESDKRERFCQEYVIDHNCTQAAIRAGYSEKTAKAQGSRLLTKVDVKKRIDELDAKVIKRLNITAEDVARDYIHIKDICLGRKKVVINGVDTGAEHWDPKTAVSALSKLGDYTGGFASEVKHSGAIGAFNVEVKSDDDLDALLGKLS